MPIQTVSPNVSPSSSPALRPSDIYLIADDLTGACDAAAAFLPAGYSVRVWLGSAALYQTPESVLAFNTCSRALTQETAAAAVSEAIGALNRAPNSSIFKKIDSAGRGPLAAEVLAAHRAVGVRATLLAPSFPAAGRTMRNGILHIRDASGQHDQLPVASLFPAEIQPQIALISSPDRLAAAVESGKAVLLCDATTQPELEALAAAASQLPGLLYAGSAGLAQAMASLYSTSGPVTPPPVSERTLIISGTPHQATQLQLEMLESKPAVAGRTASRVFRISCESDHDRILSEFAWFDPQALILTGGDTALLATRALGANSFILLGEFAPGIPWGIVQGGEANGRIVITKSGGLGLPSALCDILDSLSGNV